MQLLSAPICRLYTPSSSLILNGCSVEVCITDVHASVALWQRFTNPLGCVLNATYAFGLMTGAAVCGFEMIRKDGTRVEGLVRSKKDAENEFRQAKRLGKTTGLGREETHDVFSINVGNIQPFETVTINLRFIQALIDDENNDQVKFIFPCTYAQRYGAAPTVSANGATAIQPFQMKATVQQAGSIKSISCPSGHPISFTLHPTDPTSAEVSLKTTKGFLTQDVILVVSAANLDNPRCFIETHPSSKGNTTAMALTFVPRFEVPDVTQGMEYIFMIDRSGSMRGKKIQLVKDALVVLLRSLPTKDTTFNLVSFGSHTSKLWHYSAIYTQSSVDEATKHVDSLEADYGGTEIPSALQTVFSLHKPLHKPVAIFLLTDGSSWDVSACVSATTSALRDLPGPLPQNDRSNAKSFIRVFTLGIGAGASSDMCESIAKAGEGIAVYVQDGEEMIGKCARLVRAARTPQIDVEVEWLGVGESGETSTDWKESSGKEDDTITSEETDDDDDAKTLNNKPSSLSRPINLFSSKFIDYTKGIGPAPKQNLDPHLPPPPTIQQAPLVVPTIFPGTRVCIYAIIKTSSAPFLNTKHSDDSAPTFVKVRGVVRLTGSRVELDVPITKLIQPQSSSSISTSGFSLSSSLNISSLFTSSRAQSRAQSRVSKPLFLHILAAKALIADRQEGKHAFPPSIADSRPFNNNDEVRRAYLKKDIIRLGTTYGLTSEYTSFIAVDDRQHMVSVSRVNRQDNASSSSTATSSSNVYMIAGRSQRVQTSFTESYDPTVEDTDPTLYRQEEYAAIRQPTTRSVPSSIPRSHYNPSTGIMYAPYLEEYSARRLVTHEVAPPTPVHDSLTNDSDGLSSGYRSRGWFGKRQSVDGAREPTLKSRSPLLKRLSLSISKSSNSDNNSGIPTSETSVSPVNLNTVVSSSPLTQKPLASITQKIYTNVATMSSGERLAAIARLQRFDGGFSWSTALFSLLKLNLDTFDGMKKELSEQGIEVDIAATVLAWSWLEKNGGYEATDMAKKAGEWVGIQLGPTDTAAEKEILKNKVLTVIPLS